MVLYDHLFLEQLARRSIAGEASADDLELLIEILGGPQACELQRILDTITGVEGSEGIFIDELHKDDKLIINKVLNIDKKSIDVDDVEFNIKWSRRFNFYKAAIILLLLALGCVITMGIYDRKDWGQRKIGIVQSESIVPGNDMAILVLADGKKIFLDSAVNGILAEEPGIDIHKVQKGQVVYTNTGFDGDLTSGDSVIKENSLITPRGGKFNIVLPDGTKVWLNAASKLNFPTRFSRERVVKLEGEAYFEVAKAANKPFKVITDKNMVIKVLGTHFNVKAYPDAKEVKTTLLEGAVEVSNLKHSVKIRPGEQVIMRSNNTLIIRDNIDLEQAIAWKNGLFYFDQLDIEDIMDALSKWYDIDVDFVEKEKLSGDLFSAIVNRDNDIHDILTMLETTEKVRFEINGRRVKVLPGLNN